MKHVYRLVVLNLALVLLIACGGKGPQRPSQRRGEAAKEDSTELALMELYTQLAIAADKQIQKVAMSQEEPYALYDANSWMHIIDHGNEQLKAPTHNSVCTVHMVTYTLNGRQLLDSEVSCCIGKGEIPVGVEWNLDELHPGGKAKLIVPWYMAYGQQGTDYIPPYENVIIEIELK